MTAAIRSLVPMAHVADVERSIRYYAKLGFRLRNTFTPDGSRTPAWAWLESSGASLMVSRATAPVAASEQAVLFYLYADDVAGLRASLDREGLGPGPIAYPFYAPRGEFRLTDPDGYVLMIMHTGS